MGSFVTQQGQYDSERHDEQGKPDGDLPVDVEYHTYPGVPLSKQDAAADGDEEGDGRRHRYRW